MNGFDWNGNGQRDIGDSYIDYEISNGGSLRCILKIRLTRIRQGYIL